MAADLVSAIKQCSTVAGVARIQASLESWGMAGDRLFQNSLVQAYGRLGAVAAAVGVFDSIATKNVYSWTMMLVALVQNGDERAAIRLFWRMEQDGVAPNQWTLSSLLAASAMTGDLEQGRQLHDRVERSGLDSDPVVGTGLLSMYAAFGRAAEAEVAFSRLRHRDVVAWSALILTLVHAGRASEALRLFYEMHLEGEARPNAATFIASIAACSQLGCLHRGSRLHGRALAAGLGGSIMVSNSLIAMYGRCDGVDRARLVFDAIGDKTPASFGSMLGAYAQNGQHSEAFKLHSEMDLEGVRSDGYALVAVLGACVADSPSSMLKATQIQARAVESGLLAPPNASLSPEQQLVANALLDAYAKIGSLVDARRVFDDYCTGSVFSWTAMLAAYAAHGYCSEALELYGRMDMEGYAPSSITFVSVLSACSHHGLLEQGHRIFLSMPYDHGVEPALEHYGCMADLLSRTGHLDAAEQLTEALAGDRTSMMSLLGACKLHGDVQRGARLYGRSDPSYVGSYIMLSNIVVDRDLKVPSTGIGRTHAREPA